MEVGYLSVSYYNIIVSTSNFSKAYLALKEKYYQKGQLKTLKGIDGVSFSDFSRNPQENLQRVFEETKRGEGLLPLMEVGIPKKAGGIRKIYLSSVRDRIVYQAFFQVLQPIVEKILAPSLFSYRPNQSHYHALKNVRRIFLSKKQTYILQLDLQDYTDHLNHSILLNQFASLGADNRVCEFLDKIFKQPILGLTSLINPEKGVVQGIALCSLCANLYLSDVDHEMGGFSGVYYQRVGDDLFFMSEKKEELEKILEKLVPRLEERSLVVNLEKTKLQKMDEPFSYLGFEFKEGVLSILPKKEERIKRWFQKTLTKETFPGHFSFHQKLKKMHSLHSRKLFLQIKNWLGYYHLATNQNQIRDLDHFVQGRLVIAFLGSYKHRNYRLLKERKVFESFPFSFGRYYFPITHGRKSFSDFV